MDPGSLQTDTSHSATPRGHYRCGEGLVKDERPRLAVANRLPAEARRRSGVSTTPVLAGILLAAAGAVQWTPLKRACLVHCRSPLGFVMAESREGSLGALVMGVRHGLYCVGCCWALMTLLFVAGVMNLLWVGAIAAFVLVEKLVPHGDTVGRVAGGVLIAAGILLIVIGRG